MFSYQCFGSKYIEFVPDPEFKPNLEPDPGLGYQFLIKTVKNCTEYAIKIFFFKFAVGNAV